MTENPVKVTGTLIEAVWDDRLKNLRVVLDVLGKKHVGIIECDYSGPTMQVITAPERIGKLFAIAGDLNTRRGMRRVEEWWIFPTPDEKAEQERIAARGEDIEREFIADTRRGETNGRHSKGPHLPDESWTKSDLAFEHQDICAVDDPLPPDRPNDLYVDRLVIVSNWRGDELPAFTDGLSSDGALIVAHVYSPFSQSWPRCLLTHSQVSFTNASRAQEQAIVTALRKLQCAPEDLRVIVESTRAAVR